jgi:hypothetical protein
MKMNAQTYTISKSRIITDIFTDKLSKSDISVKKYFAKLVTLGQLEVEGKNKGRKYKISK